MVIVNTNSIKHTELLSLLIDQIFEVNFREVVGLTDENQKLSKNNISKKG